MSPAHQRLVENFHLSFLIPVLVTGIQCVQVLGCDRLFPSWYTFIQGADAPWLDSFDKHRNEGRWGGRFPRIACYLIWLAVRNVH
ncbi:hypothetical protein ATY75_19105 [Rhizobium sp. N122]|nr:hypothetical protein ATY75_19105 [Rhizobium sp. N122]